MRVGCGVFYSADGVQILSQRAFIPLAFGKVQVAATLPETSKRGSGFSSKSVIFFTYSTMSERYSFSNAYYMAGLVTSYFQVQGGHEATVKRQGQEAVDV